MLYSSWHRTSAVVLLWSFGWLQLCSYQLGHSIVQPAQAAPHVLKNTACLPVWGVLRACSTCTEGHLSLCCTGQVLGSGGGGGGWTFSAHSILAETRAEGTCTDECVHVIVLSTFAMLSGPKRGFGAAQAFVRDRMSQAGRRQGA